MAKKKVPRRRYRVWFEQVNQTYIDVRAIDADDAVVKAERAWRRENYPPKFGDIKELG